MVGVEDSSFGNLYSDDACWGNPCKIVSALTEEHSFANAGFASAFDYEPSPSTL